MLYLTYIRPIVGYAATVWFPHTQYNIHSVEMIQQKAARFVFNDFTRLSSVSSYYVRAFRMGHFGEVM